MNVIRCRHHHELIFKRDMEEKGRKKSPDGILLQDAAALDSCAIAVCVQLRLVVAECKADAVEEAAFAEALRRHILCVLSGSAAHPAERNAGHQHQDHREHFRREAQNDVRRVDARTRLRAEACRPQHTDEGQNETHKRIGHAAADEDTLLLDGRW